MFSRETLIRSSAFGVLFLLAEKKEQLLYTMIGSVATSCFTTYLSNKQVISQNTKSFFDFMVGGLAYGASHYCFGNLFKVNKVPDYIASPLIFGPIPTLHMGLGFKLAQHLYPPKEEIKPQQDIKKTEPKKLEPKELPRELHTFLTQTLKICLVKSKLLSAIPGEALCSSILSYFAINFAQLTLFKDDKIITPYKAYKTFAPYWDSIKRGGASYVSTSAGEESHKYTEKGTLSSCYIYSIAYCIGRKIFDDVMKLGTNIYKNGSGGRPFEDFEKVRSETQSSKHAYRS